MGSRGAVAEAEERAEAADRLAAIEARRLLSLQRACRGPIGSRARRTFAVAWPKAVAGVSSMWT
jgi:hypothetical protein